MEPVRIFCAALGTLGDVHPPLAVALAARDLGAEMTLGVGAEYLDKVRGEGVPAVPLMDSMETVLRVRGWSRDAFMAGCRRDPGLIMREMVMPALLSTCRAIDAAGQGHEVLTGSPLGLAAAIVAEAQGKPYVPFLFAPPRAALVGPRQLEFERAIALRNLGPPIDAARAAGGLGPLTATPPFDFDGDVPFRLGLFPRLFVSAQAQGQSPLHVVGAWRYDADAPGRDALDPDLAAFLAEGPPPVLATLGTAVDAEGNAFFHGCLAAIRHLGLRALLVAGRGWDGPPRGEDFIAVRYAPYRQVFPRCAAIIHHGGMGTLTFALEAARPQLILPVAFDQPHNAELCRRRGLAAAIPFAQATAESVAHALHGLLRIGESPQLRQAAASIGEEAGAHDAARRLIDLALFRRRNVA